MQDVNQDSSNLSENEDIKKLAERHKDLIEKADLFKGLIKKDKAWEKFVDIVHKNVGIINAQIQKASIADAVLSDDKEVLKAVAKLEIQRDVMLWMIRVPENIIKKEISLGKKIKKKEKKAHGNA